MVNTVFVFEVLIDGSVLLENKPKKLRVVCIAPSVGR